MAVDDREARLEEPNRAYAVGKEENSVSIPKLELELPQN
jgi:hypothetical protein